MLSTDHFADIARFFQIEDDQRQVVVHSQRNGRHIHDFELFFKNLHIGNGRYEGCIGMFDPEVLCSMEATASLVSD